MNKKIILVSAGVIALVIVASYGVIGGELTFLTPADNDDTIDLEIDTMPIDVVDNDDTIDLEIDTMPIDVADNVNPEISTVPIGTVDIETTLVLDNIENVAIPEDIAAANNAFAIDFYKHVATDDKNVFFSPTSMYVAFSVLYEGARYDTAEQIQQVFGINPDRDARHNAAAHLMSSLNQDDPHTTLELANSLWIADGFRPHDSYLDVTHSTYLAGEEIVDYYYDGANQISDWVYNKTHKKIPTVLNKDNVVDSVYMIVVNSAYFKGTWETKFPKNSTTPSDFYIDSTRSIAVDFMNVKGVFDHASANGAKVLRLPYNDDRLSMLVILPEDIDGIEQLRENLSPELLQKWNQNMLQGEIDLSLPKFEIKTHYDLAAILTDLGMPDVFNWRANLLGLLGTPPDYIDPGPPLNIGEALHDAYIRINEEGTEATTASMTGTIMVDSAKPPAQSFTADRPFIFVIQDDNSGAILFMGSMDDPRGLTIGPVYAGGALGQEDPGEQNDEPELVLTFNGTEAASPMSISGSVVFTASASDPEDDPITIGIIPDELFPGVMSVSDHQNGTATITVDATNAPAGTYVLWVEVSDPNENHDRIPYALIVE